LGKGRLRRKDVLMVSQKTCTTSLSTLSHGEKGSRGELQKRVGGGKERGGWLSPLRNPTLGIGEKAVVAGR